MSALTAREAYPRWAPAYEEETAVSYLENLVVARMGPSPAGRRLLDVGCGTGRRLREAGAAFAVGVDLSPEMLSVVPAQAGTQRRPPSSVIPAKAGTQRLSPSSVIPAKAGTQRLSPSAVVPAKAGIQRLSPSAVIPANAGTQRLSHAGEWAEPAHAEKDVSKGAAFREPQRHWAPAFAGMTMAAAAEATALPLADSLFDLVWCRLMIGHVASAPSVYAELARVTRPGATIVVTDFHPAAAAAGHRRTFRDQDGVLCEIEHFIHPLVTHIASASAVGLELAESRDGVVGPEILPFYARAGRAAAYGEQEGMPLVLGLTFVKVGDA